jgi:hypothetical protein
LSTHNQRNNNNNTGHGRHVTSCSASTITTSHHASRTMMMVVVLVGEGGGTETKLMQSRTNQIRFDAKLQPIRLVVLPSLATLTGHSRYWQRILSTIIVGCAVVYDDKYKHYYFLFSRSSINKSMARRDTHM